MTKILLLSTAIIMSFITQSKAEDANGEMIAIKAVLSVCKEKCSDDNKLVTTVNILKAKLNKNCNNISKITTTSCASSMISFIEIYEEENLVFKLLPNGQTEIGQGYTTDDGAKMFAAALAEIIKQGREK